MANNFKPITMKQLRQVAFADVSNFDPTTNTITIPKYTKPSYNLGSVYIITLPKDIINNPNTILASNWNHGGYPKYFCYKAYISDTKGRMIYIDAVEFDLDANKDRTGMWSGWLDINTITQIRKI